MPDAQQPPSPQPESGGTDDTAQIPRVEEPPAWDAPPWQVSPPYAPSYADPAPAPARHASLVPVLAGGLALLLVVAGVFGYLAVTASGKLDRAKIDLATAQDARQETADSLDRTRSELSDAREALKEAQARAESAEGDLSAAQEATASQQQLIADLRVCLDGVLVSMQALGGNDPARAQAELARVKPSCDRAYQQAETLDS